MKIRTITLGLPGLPTKRGMSRAAEQLNDAACVFEEEGYTVQTRRIALPHWDAELGRLRPGAAKETMELIDSLCAEFGIDFCSVGIIKDPSQISEVVPIIAKSERLFASVDLSSFEEGLHEKALFNAAADAIRYFALHSEGGLGNFRFGSGFCLKPGNPFFPGAYHADYEPKFGVGLENSDLLVKAFKLAQDRELVSACLYEVLAAEFIAVENVALKAAQKLGIGFNGIDTSIAPSLAPQESIVEAFHAVGLNFGAAGTLALCGVITDVLKRIPVLRVGYCGLMLSILEDVGLAAAAAAGHCRVPDLLAYSSVCGVGLDLIPVPGDVTASQLCNVLLDVATIATKLNKPLSARIVPVPNRVFGEKTVFDSPYLCNSQVMAI